MIGYITEAKNPIHGNAINEIIHTIFSTKLDIEKISVVKIAKNRAQMHIDTIFTQVKRNVWVLYGRYSENGLHRQRKWRRATAQRPGPQLILRGLCSSWLQEATEFVAKHRVHVIALPCAA